MTATLLLLMSYEMMGSAAHEWIGMVMAVLLILHHILNWRWYRNLLRGKYNFLRIVQTGLVVLILTAMIGSMASGAILSRHIFSFLHISGGYGTARLTHMLCAFWGFLLLSLHLGLHWGMLLGNRKRLRNRIPPAVPHILAICVAGYGVYALWQREILSYLFLKIPFVYYDYAEPLLRFLLDYLFVMGLFVVIGRYLVQGWKWLRKKRR